MQVIAVCAEPDVELRRRVTERVLKQYVLARTQVEMPLRVIVDAKDGVTVLLEDPAVADLLEQFSLPVRVVESIDDPESTLLEV